MSLEKSIYFYKKNKNSLEKLKKVIDILNNVWYIMFRISEQRKENDKMAYDYSKLLGRMKEKKLTQETVAKKAGMRPTTLSQKLNNKGKFKQTEISNICCILAIADSEIGQYFFTHEVQKN